MIGCFLAKHNAILSKNDVTYICSLEWPRGRVEPSSINKNGKPNEKDPIKELIRDEGINLSVLKVFHTSYLYVTL